MTFQVDGVKPHSFGTEAMRMPTSRLDCCKVEAKRPTTFQDPEVHPHSFGTKAMWWASNSLQCCSNMHMALKSNLSVKDNEQAD